MEFMQDMSKFTYNDSDQIIAADLLGGPEVGKIIRMEETEDKKRPLKIFLEGFDKPFLPCLTSRRLLLGCWGKDGTKWIGRSMRLYREPEVTYGGDKVGGARFSHLTDLESDQVTITVQKNKKQTEKITIYRLVIGEQKPMSPEVFKEKLPKVAEAIKSGKLDAMAAIARLEKTANLTEDQKKEVMKLGAPADEPSPDATDPDATEPDATDSGFDFPQE